jgi:hypothetical protein
MTDVNEKAKELRQKIKKKFKNASRFSTLSGIPYHFIQNALKKDNELLLRRIEREVEKTEDRPIFDEVNDDLIAKVKRALKGRDLPQWCQDNGVPHWWLKSFLRGDVRFKTHPRVKRLMILLDISE